MGIDEAILIMENERPHCGEKLTFTEGELCEAYTWAIGALKELSSAQPEVRPIDYQDCSNAMLKMWMDNVVTDGEYNRIMDKLNTHWGDGE